MKLVALMVLLVGCQHEAARPTPTEPPEKAPYVDPMTRALRAFEADHAVDYQRPFVLKHDDRSATLKLLREACDRREYIPDQSALACRIAAQIDTYEPNIYDRYRSVTERCEAGDLLSCRVLPDDVEGAIGRFDDLPGKQSRACVEDSQYCVDLGEECRQGFSFACEKLVDDYPFRDPRREGTKKEANQFAKQGCTNGIAADCDRIEGDLTFEEAQQFCWLTDKCTALADVYAQRGDRISARNAMERACEYTEDLDTCRALANRYLDRTYPEPVPGRGKLLLAWACPDFDLFASDNTLFECAAL
ncbi:MAG: hypothetical protein QM831_19730 [Kofleriaceae bacterium]